MSAAPEYPAATLRPRLGEPGGSGGVSLLFPGQGAQDVRMLDGVATLPEFREHYQLICDLLEMDVRVEIERSPDLLRRNAVSSLLTILVSALMLAEWRSSRDTGPRCVAGYSIGQWTALHAAGALDFPALSTIVLARARYMDACVSREPSGMYAVLGLPLAQIEAVLAELREDGHRVYVSNLNCPGNVSIAGTLTALEAAMPSLAVLAPKKLSPIPVSGAWHCPILDEAGKQFAEYLARMELAPTDVPVMDNVTGSWLPDDPEQRLSRLAQHLISPVQWHAGIRTCIAASFTHFLEMGFGGSLSKLGFFIDRRAVFERFDAPSAPTAQASNARGSPCAG